MDDENSSRAQPSAAAAWMEHRQDACALAIGPDRDFTLAAGAAAPPGSAGNIGWDIERFESEGWNFQ